MTTTNKPDDAFDTKVTNRKSPDHDDGLLWPSLGRLGRDGKGYRAGVDFTTTADDGGGGVCLDAPDPSKPGVHSPLYSANALDVFRVFVVVYARNRWPRSGLDAMMNQEPEVCG
jgi:hypothetical protein